MNTPALQKQTVSSMRRAAVIAPTWTSPAGRLPPLSAFTWDHLSSWVTQLRTFSRSRQASFCSSLSGRVDNPQSPIEKPAIYSYFFHRFRRTFIHTYKRFVGSEALTAKRPFRCSNLACHVEITDEIVARRRDRGFSQLTCPVCEQAISLLFGCGSFKSWHFEQADSELLLDGDGWSCPGCRSAWPALGSTAARGASTAPPKRAGTTSPFRRAW